MASFVVSDLIEKYATPQQIKEGFDLADYFEGQPKKMFTAGQEIEQTPENKLSKEIVLPKYVKQLKDTFDTEVVVSQNDVELLQNQEYLLKFQKNKFWPIEELEEYFSSLTITDEPIFISKALTITSPLSFIKNHLAAVKLNNGKPIFRAHYDRLVVLKEILTKK